MSILVRDIEGPNELRSKDRDQKAKPLWRRLGSTGGKQRPDGRKGGKLKTQNSPHKPRIRKKPPRETRKPTPALGLFFCFLFFVFFHFFSFSWHLVFGIWVLGFWGFGVLVGGRQRTKAAQKKGPSETTGALFPPLTKRYQKVPLKPTCARRPLLTTSRS